MPYTQDDLKLANEHVAEAEALVERQRDRVDELRRHGQPTEAAHEILVILLELRHQLTKHRNVISEALSAGSIAPAQPEDEPKP